jgi:hypothetical protein
VIPPVLVREAGHVRHRASCRPTSSSCSSPATTTSTSSAPPRCRWPPCTWTSCSTRTSSRSATSGTRPASGVRPARTARTPAGSCGCTSSRRSSCSRSCTPTLRRRARADPVDRGGDLLRPRIHAQVVDIPVGDLGASAARKFDLEAWMPGQDAYREVTSCSNTTDYQARRLKARIRVRRRQRAGAHAQRHRAGGPAGHHRARRAAPAGGRHRARPRCGRSLQPYLGREVLFAAPADRSAIGVTSTAGRSTVSWRTGS